MRAQRRAEEPRAPRLFCVRGSGGARAAAFDAAQPAVQLPVLGAERAVVARALVADGDADDLARGRVGLQRDGLHRGALELPRRQLDADDVADVVVDAVALVRRVA